MSRRGNDLVRRYLWMAALSAIRFNPAVRALYARVVAKHPQHKSVAVGHAMRKLLHLVFALCKSGRPFDPDHYPWQTPAHIEISDNDMSVINQISDNDMSANSQAAGHTPDVLPAQPVVTAACADSVAEATAVGESSLVDFAHVKEQLSLAAGARSTRSVGSPAWQWSAASRPLSAASWRRSRPQLQRQPGVQRLPVL